MANVDAKTVAEHIGVSPKAFRRFMREYVKRSGGEVGVNTPGRGGRYSFDEDSLDAIADAYRAWGARSGAMHFTLADFTPEGEGEGDA